MHGATDLKPPFRGCADGQDRPSLRDRHHATAGRGSVWLAGFLKWVPGRLFCGFAKISAVTPGAVGDQADEGPEALADPGSRNFATQTEGRVTPGTICGAGGGGCPLDIFRAWICGLGTRPEGCRTCKGACIKNLTLRSRVEEKGKTQEGCKFILVACPKRNRIPLSRDLLLVYKQGRKAMVMARFPVAEVRSAFVEDLRKTIKADSIRAAFF